MNQEQLKLLFDSNFPQKVKLKIVQPDIICSGREFVTSHYRGTISKKGLYDDKEVLFIDFKYKGNNITGHLDNKGEFIETYLKDIKLK